MDKLIIDDREHAIPVYKEADFPGIEVKKDDRNKSK